MNELIIDNVKIRNLSKTVATDMILLAVIYYLPTCSHLVAFPLYLLDPMRLMLFVGILLSGNKLNAYILAATLPLFSYFVGGHPIFLKSALICVELCVNVAFFWILLRKVKSIFWVTLISIIISKVVYYLLKFFFVKAGLLQMGIISTNVMVQSATVLVLAVFMSILFKKKGNTYNV